MRLSALSLAVCLGLLAACGKDERPRRSATVPAGQPVRVAGVEYAFDPASVTTGAGPVRFVLVNSGSLAHNLKVFAGDRELGGTPTFESGEQGAASLRLRPGRYRMVCTVGNHEQLGMTGDLTVR